MRQGRRYGLSTAQSIDIWRLWKAGESLHEIGRALGKDHGSIQFLLSKRGGIAPPVRRRSLRTLTLDEREDISRGIASGSSIREIAEGLQRPASTVSREVARHGGRPLYRFQIERRRRLLRPLPSSCKSCGWKSMPGEVSPSTVEPLSGGRLLLLAALLTAEGYTADDAFRRLTTARGLQVPDTPDQIRWVERFAERHVR